MVVSMVPLRPSQTAGGPPSRLRSRAAGPAGWAWPEVGGRLGGGAERRCPQTPRGETIAREGQGAMPVRRWGDGLPHASQLEAELGEEGVREPRARAGGLGPWLRAQVFGIPGPARNLRGGHCCQRCAPRAGQGKGWERPSRRNHRASCPSGAYSLEQIRVLRILRWRIVKNLYGGGSSTWAGLPRERTHLNGLRSGENC